ncbi:hypothetical protein [Microbispora sp. KK1-11]|uniref:hypothetical protein n=1 Tax=Microbispora sp. KK1-11 TaxID=2053005 RepID=UPI001158C69F|nr:hypothetical protein [Microbispora sp. KK1-11]TQS25181.1 hypothetical protein FLW16_32170 [Microbispora sp. KK1-11]
MTDVLVTEISLEDAGAVEALGRERAPGAYTPARVAERPPPLPPNVNRRLMTSAVTERVRRLAAEKGIEGLHLRVVSHPLSMQGSVAMAPLHFALAFRHGRTRVTGPVFVSALHEAELTLPPAVQKEPWAAGLREVRTPLTPGERRRLLEHYLREYRDGASASTDLTVICVPARSPVARAASPTHQALLGVAGAPPLGVGAWDGYAVWHRAPRPLEPPLLDRLVLLRDEWSAQTRRAYEAGRNDPASTQGHSELAVFVDWVRSSWRQALSNRGDAV